ncbi:MAG: DUF2304 family protein [Candidatus Woesearchaeota archaeon]
MILGVQIVGIIFALAMMYAAFVHYKRKVLTQLEHLFWQITWVIFLLVSVFPQTGSFLARSLDITRTMDVFVVLGLVFVLGIVFANYISIRKTTHKVEEAIRVLAMQKTEKKK